MSDFQFSNPDEKWKEIFGFPGYEVSDQGRVRSYFKATGGKKFPGSIIAKTVQRILKPCPDFSNHLAAYLRKNGTKTYRFSIHRLVLTAFVGPCPFGNEGCHNDGNPDNNFLENLRWDTRRNNAQDMIIHGTVLAGEKNPKAKLTESQVIEIRERAGNGELLINLAEIYCVHPVHISGIVHRKYWAHI